MKNPRELTKDDIISTAVRFIWFKKLPKWTVIVNNRQLPARPLILEAAGVPPNDPTNSHQAVAILQRLGFETQYDQTARQSKSRDEQAEKTTDLHSLVHQFHQISQEVPERAWQALPSDMSANLDHYLYGTKKREE
jgi:hypothetical protein